jgi:hypothetical protein
VLIACASSASLPTNDHRINYYAYPRYIHFLFPVWLMAGVVALRAADSRRLRVLAASATGVVLFCASVVYLRLQFNKAYIFLPFDMPETTFLSGEWSAIRVVRPTLIALVVFAGLVVALPRRRLAAVAVVGVAALQFGVLVASVEHITKPMTVDQYRADTPRLVRDLGLGPGDVVAVSRETQWYLAWNVMREVSWNQVLLFDSSHEGPPAGANIIIAPYGYTDGQARNWAGKPAFHVLAVDSHHHWAVWRRN